MTPPPDDRPGDAALGYAALEGLGVVLVGPGMAVAMAGMVLADNGADVRHVVRPGGGRDRDRPGSVVWGRRTQGVALDLTDATDRGRFDDMISATDAAVANRARAR